MAGGREVESWDNVNGRKMGKFLKEILVYDDNEDKWTKTGDLCHARAYHAVSLVPAVVEDQCLFTIDC